MNDYISRKEAIEKIKEEGILGDGYSDTERENDVIKMLNYIPAADVQPIKRGRWFLRGGNWCCSACNRKTLLTLESNIGGCKEYGTVKTNYCPNCGADMRGGKPNE